MKNVQSNTQKRKTTNDGKNRITKARKKSDHLEKRKIINAESIKQTEMKEKIKKEYLKRTMKLLKTKLLSRILLQRDKHLGYH